MKVLLLEGIHEVAESQLRQQGLHVERLNQALKESELIAKLADVTLLGIRSKTQITPAVLSAAKNLISIGAFCIGTNQIALNDAAKKGVCVFNAPFSNTRSVAELVMAEIVMLSRGLSDRAAEMHRGEWKKLAQGAHEVRGKTLGVIGYGHIGTQIGLLAEFFGMRVLFFDVSSKLPLGNTRQCDSLEELLRNSDFVTLHVPETPQTKGMISAKELSQMKKEACLINASRGTVVDLDALAKAITSKHLSGAALDVYPEEPESNSSSGFKTPLQGLPNVIMTPHIGGSTLEAQESIGREVATSFTRFVTTGASIGAVNFPPIEMPRPPGTHRVSHVHSNVPGVLRDVNKIISDLQANVHAQTLSTTEAIGYLLIDLDSAVADEVCSRLQKLSTTLKARVVEPTI